MSSPNDSNADGGRRATPQRQLSRRRRMLLKVLAPMLAALLKATWSLFRFEVHGDRQLRELAAAGQAMIFAFWHEGLLVVCWYMAKLLKTGVNATFLISPSVDGEIGVQILANFGSQAVRGSARRSGAAALRRLVAAIRTNGQSPCITLDGSKGPRRSCKPGAIAVAHLANVPIVPIGFAAARAWRLRSWDRHLIPKPLAKVLIQVGLPYRVASDLDDDRMEEARRDLEARVNHEMCTAEAALGIVSQAPAPQGEPREEAP